MRKFFQFFLDNKLLTALLLVLLTGWGLVNAPFGWDIPILPSDPVPVDAIPDIGENQQIVFTKWPGRSPQDIEDQITYPLSSSLLGIPGVKTVRSSSAFGFSSIYIIFEEDIEFYWSRSRILEKISSLPPGTLPKDASPSLGPDATALGQVYWYTLEGRDSTGQTTGGWDLEELRTIQDYYVKYGLLAADGVSEVASIGGFVKEYQVDVNPELLRSYDISLHQVANAVRKSNLDAGAKTIEINKAEYLVRGIGYLKSINDLESAVVAVKDNVPVRIKDVATVQLGPANRRGVLDKGGAEVVGGVVVTRFGANPLAVIEDVKEKVEQLSAGMPSKTLSDGTHSKLTIVPFYDRSGLIRETIGTLEEALTLEVLITILVIIIMISNLRASVMITLMLPFSVLLVFIAMRYTGVDANVVALSGIAIAIGTIVDVGIILTENMTKGLKSASKETSVAKTIIQSNTEVAPAVITAVLTTIVSFLPVFVLEGAEGKLFQPLAWTKTFALLAALVSGLLFLPTIGHWLFGIKKQAGNVRLVLNASLLVLGGALLFTSWSSVGLIAIAVGLAALLQIQIESEEWYIKYLHSILIGLVVTWLLAAFWMPLGVTVGTIGNFIFVALIVALVLGGFMVFHHFYEQMLRWCLNNKGKFLLIPLTIILFGLLCWKGYNKTLGQLFGNSEQSNGAPGFMAKHFPGIGEEFMPALDEGSFLLMPTSMAHAGVEENQRVLRQLDMAVSAIPEVESVVGKLGRVESAIDPAPISMYENLINYKSEYAVNERGRKLRFAVDDNGKYQTKSGKLFDPEIDNLKDIRQEDLIEDEDGQYFRQWRSHIHTTQDIWDEVVKVSRIPGVTSSPKLQPIETRLVMLQTGMRAPMGIKIQGPTLEAIEKFGFDLEEVLKEVKSIEASAVFADRVVGKPYLHLNINRDAISLYGLSIEQVQQHIQMAVGGMPQTFTVEGRERYPVRVRYPRELRDHPDELLNIVIKTPTQQHIKLKELVSIEYARGPQMIKSENTFLISYVLFDKTEKVAELTAVKDAEELITERIASGELKVPEGVTYAFTGNYENQLRFADRFMIILPIVLVIIFLILYLQFRSVAVSIMVFSGIAVAFCGGFIMLWLYGQDWFLNFSIGGIDMRGVFNIQTINLSVAVWVGFIALFGIATDDGVIMATYQNQNLKRRSPKTKVAIHDTVTEAGLRRIKPCLMTSATTILALLPILTSSGRGSDIMIPMAIPAVGGMSISLITLFVIPVLFCWWQEFNLKTETHA